VDVIEQLRNDLQLSKKKREDLIPNWQLNVAERRGKDVDTVADDSRSMVPMDWTLTKTKAAQLFSQLPQVRLIAKNKTFETAVPVAAKIVNDLLKQANVEAVMSECVVDCINAAGIGGAIVRYESLTETVQLPAVDPAAIAMAQMAAPEAPAVEDPANPVPQVGSLRTTDRRFCVDRVSPADLLCPTHFRLSDWDKSPWLGHSDRGQWAKVKRLFPPNPTTGQRGLTDEDKEKVVGAVAKKPGVVDLASISEAEKKSQEELVEYDELFYWRYLYHEDEKYYDAIQRVVFVAGIEEPVINEPWTGQKFDDQNGGYTGVCRLPVRVLTLNYISDEAIPPSDSAIIRPQVKELQESRQHMKDQRKHSRPLRWFDVDHVDPTITGDLIKGTWQGMIPTIGAGDRAIGEVARSSYPKENLEFDRILKQDIQEAVSVGPNQSGMFASGERSASEARIVQQSFQTEIGLQRAKVAAFFVGIAEVMFGLWALFGEIEPLGIGASIGEEGAQRLAQWDRAQINQKFIADVRADSTVRLDAKELVEQLTSVLNVTAQSGFINPEPLIRRILDASGVDPEDVLVKPTPKGPEPPKITYSFKGEDLANPFVIAIIGKSGQAPSPEEVDAAKLVLQSMVTPPKPPAPPTAPPPPPGGGPHAMPPVTNPEVPEKPFPDWESNPRINTRRSEG
jgi:hypothetical protein